MPKRKKKLIEKAYTLGEKMGLSVWCEDEAGPFQTIPYPGQSWHPEGLPHRLPHEYVRSGTAKLMTLFHPKTGRLRVRGTTSTANQVLHPWLKEELTAILKGLPKVKKTHKAKQNRALWQTWQAGLEMPITLPEDLPPLRLLLVMDNLKGHHTTSLILWLFSQGIMPLYTPLGGSWLNMTESIQRILKRRGLDGHYPQTPEQIIDWLEATAAGWNGNPTPFEWGGKRAKRRGRSRNRRYAIGGSRAFTRSPLRRSKSALYKWQRAYQLTH